MRRHVKRTHSPSLTLGTSPRWFCTGALGILKISIYCIIDRSCAAPTQLNHQAQCVPGGNFSADAAECMGYLGTPWHRRSNYGKMHQIKLCLFSGFKSYGFRVQRFWLSIVDTAQFSFRFCWFGWFAMGGGGLGFAYLSSRRWYRDKE
jgi:hypothetical protein